MHIHDTIVDATIDERGFIGSLRSRDGRTLSADLYIDCTGFRGLLINQVLKEPFLSYGAHLLCDRALAIPQPTDPAAPSVNSCTTAIAASHGWIFDIPLFHRRGTGYIYSSAFTSDDAAERELRQHFGLTAEGGPAPRRINMRVGRTRRAWVGNCVSLGLASGFTDPLHATSILLIERGLYYLDMYFPDSDFSPILAEVYNRGMTEEFEGTLGFIFLHYFASPRRDTPFWCAATSAVAPAPAAEILELWDRLGLESGALAAPLTHINETFGTCAVPNMLVGVGRLPRRGREEVRRDRAAPLSPADEDAAAAEQDRLAALPDHATYLEQLNSGSLDAFRELFVARHQG